MNIAAMSRKRQAVFFVVGMAATTLALVLIYSIVHGSTTSTDIRETQQTNSPLLAKIDKQSAQIKRLARDIRSCTTPGRPCHQRGQDATATAVGDINEVIVIAAACASGPVERTVEEIQSCVIERLARKP